MILTHVPYKHVPSGRVYVPTDVTDKHVVLRAMSAGDVTQVCTVETFTKTFERVHEPKPVPGWDEEL